MTEATSSRSGDLDRPRRCNSGSSLEVPEDILELVKESGWDSTEDLNSDCRKYTNMLLYGEKHPNLNIEKDLEMLKGLSSCLESKYYVSLEESQQFQMKYHDKFQSLVEKLVERVPDIKDLQGYEHATTHTEKYLIEQALKKKGQEVKLQVVDPALMFHLEDLRKQLMHYEKCEGDTLRFQKIDRLRRMVDGLIRIVATIKAEQRISEESKKHEQSWEEAENCDYGWYGDNKRQKHQKLVDRKEVEEGLLNVLEEVSGKLLERHDVDKFRMKWDYMVDQFSMIIDYLN